MTNEQDVNNKHVYDDPKNIRRIFVIDTHQIFKRYIKVGFTEEQAEALVYSLVDMSTLIINHVNESKRSQ